MSIIPDHYELVDRIEIRFVNGDKIALEGDDAVMWARAVDWGLRRFHVEQFEKYSKLVTNPEWKVVDD